MIKRGLLFIWIVLFLIGCSLTGNSGANSDQNANSIENESTNAEAAEVSMPKLPEIPVTDAQKEILASVFHISDVDHLVRGLHGTADLGGLLITLDEIVRLKGSDGVDLILPIWSAENTNAEEISTFNHILSSVIGPDNSLVDTVSRPDSYPVESLSRIPWLNQGESASFYYYVSEYVPGQYLAIMRRADGTGDHYYFVFEME